MDKRLKEIMPSFIAIFIALFIGGIIMITKGVNPGAAYMDMAKSAFYQTSPRSPFLSGLTKTLLAATPLIYSALAAMVAFKAGLFNIGAQGQMIAGGLAATFWAVTFRNYFLGNLFIVLAVAVIAGFLWAGIAGFLKSKFGVNEVISTIMLNYIIFEIQNFLLNGILKDPNSGSTQSAKVFEGARLPSLFYSVTKQRLNLGFIIAVLLATGIYIFFKYFKKGYEITINEKVKDKVFLAGAKAEDGVLKTNGGRVLSVIGVGKTVEEARSDAYENIKYVTFEGAYCRTDIGTHK